MFLQLLFGLNLGLSKDGVRLYSRAQPLSAVTKRALIRFMVHTNLALTIRVFAKKGDVLVIAALSSPSVVALYKIAMRIADSLMLISDPLVTVTYPTLSRYNAEGRPNRDEEPYPIAVSKHGMCLGLSLMIFALFGKWLIGIAAGQDFTAAFSACSIMMGGALLSMVFFWVRPLLLVHAKTGKLLIISLISTGLRFALLAAFIPLWGLSGAAWSFVAYHHL
jgi:O-antigen/teichoic acid export membrane protein